MSKKEDISRGVRGHAPPEILKVEIKICATWGILEANLKKSSTLMFMMNISFVPSICSHRSTIFIFIEKKSTHFLTTTVKNLTFFLSPTLCVCVCVCVCVWCVCVCVCVSVEREKENCILSQTCLPQKTSVSTPNCLCPYFQIYNRII